VALHACGALTDVALGHAVLKEASFVVCPCCFQSNPHLSVPVSPSNDPSHGTIVSVEEWLGVSSERYHLLKRVAEVQGDLKLANESIHSICALRARAVERRSSRQMNVEIKTFPIAYSTRNFCLVGSFSPPIGLGVE
jgi:hypothetical protein